MAVFNDDHVPRNAKVHSIKEVLETFFKNSPLTKKYKETTLTMAWQRMMGENVAQATQRIFIKDRKLFVELNSAPLKSELTMAKSHIVSQINLQMGEKMIDEVIFI